MEKSGEIRSKYNSKKIEKIQVWEPIRIEVILNGLK